MVLRRTWNVTAQPPPELNFQRPQDNVVHKFSFWQDLGTLFSTSASVPTSSGMNFQLTNCPNASTLVALFDQYRIARLEVWIQPQSTNNGGHAGMLYSAVDYDASASLTVTAISQLSNVVVGPASTIGHYHNFVPHVAVAAYSGAFSSFANETSPWIDTASSTVQHYGVIISAGVTTDVIPIDGQVRYHLEFRNTI
jgi:hypothetical protein